MRKILIYKNRIEFYIHEDGLASFSWDHAKHRNHGPAVIWRNDYQEWWYHGKLHREDGPAVIYSSGAEEWWISGKLIQE